MYRRMLFLSCLLFVAALASSALGASTWKAASTDNNWYNSVNWTGGLPVSSANVIIPGTSAKVPVIDSANGGPVSVTYIQIGSGSSGSTLKPALKIVNHSTVTVTASQGLYIASNATGNGFYSIDVNDSTLNSTIAALILNIGGSTGGQSEGTLNLKNSSLSTAANNVYLGGQDGHTAGSSGTINLTNSTYSCNSSANFYLGLASNGPSTGTLNVLGSSICNIGSGTASRLYIGGSSLAAGSTVGNTGIVKVDGAGSTLNVANRVEIGGASAGPSTGRLSITNGGKFAPGGWVYVGGSLGSAASGSSGIVDINSSTFNNTGNNFYLGYASNGNSTGTLNVNKGTLNSYSLKLGTPWSTVKNLGIANISGASADVNLAANLFVGNNEGAMAGRISEGRLNITGGLVKVGGYINVAPDTNNADITGIIHLDGGTLQQVGTTYPVIGTKGHIDITGGTLILSKDRTTAWVDTAVAQGQLTGYGSSRGIVRSYDSGTDQTTVTADLTAATKAYNPTPTSGSIGQTVSAAANDTLTWGTGSGAIHHQVYLGTVLADVTNATTGYTQVDVNSYTPALQLGTKYYWRVDEVHAGGTTKGDVWSFTTYAFVTVDDFSDYTSTSLPVSWPNAALSTVIYHGTVATDAQAMKISYNTTPSQPYEVTRAFPAAQNWNVLSAADLTLFFRTDANNTASVPSLYAKVEDNTGHSATVLWTGDPNALKVANTWWAYYGLAGWTQWDISWQSFAAANPLLDPTHILKLTIGIGSGTTASGTLYIDDIRLYPARCVATNTYAGDLTGDCTIDMNDLALFVQAWEADLNPSPQTPHRGPILSYSFDETSGTVAHDSSGGYNGTVTDSNANHWNTGGEQAGCLHFDGNFAVDVNDASAFNSIDKAITISMWVNGDPSLWDSTNRTFVANAGFAGGPTRADGSFSSYTLLCYMPSWTGTNTGSISFVAKNIDYARYLIQDFSEVIGTWTHYALVEDINSGTQSIYRDGQLVLKDTDVAVTSLSGMTKLRVGGYNAANYRGKIDEFKVYDYALSQAEILSVAGFSSPQQITSDADLNNDSKVNFTDFATLAELGSKPATSRDNTLLQY